MKPMLAGRVEIEDLDRLRWPLYVSLKLDGIRARVENGRLMSRRGLPIPNAFVQSEVRDWPEGVEGELIVPGPRRMVSSAIMSRSGEPDFTFHVFDIARPDMEFMPLAQRLDTTASLLEYCVRTTMVVQHTVFSAEDARVLATRWIEAGAEGAVLRDPNGHYKRGRSTLREQLLLKLKLQDDTEAVVLFLAEEMENLNAEDTRGRRHGFAEGKFGKRRLGSVTCRFDDGAEFNCGSGFTAEERELYWARPELLLGKRITVEHEKGRAPGQRPSFPIFKGIREDL